MNRNEARALREERGAIAKQMNDLAEAGITSANKQQFEALDGKQKELKTKIDAIERAAEVYSETRGTGRPPNAQLGGEESPAKERDLAELRAFGGYLRFGMSEMDAENRDLLRRDRETRDMGTSGQGAYPGITSGAGIFVPVGFRMAIDSALKYFGPMLRGGQGDPTIIDTETGQILPFPTDNDTTVSGEFIGENQQVTIGDVSIGQISFSAYKVSSKMIKASMELMQDSAFDFEGYLARKFAERSARAVNTKFTIGAGTTEPQGIVTGATLGTTAVGASGNDGSSGVNTIGSDDMTTLEHSVDPLYRPGAKWMFHDTTLAALKRVKDKYGRPLWQQSVAVGAPDTINGYEYLINNDMDQLQTQAASPTVTRKTVLFGAMSKYVIRRVKDISVLRLTERFADFGQVAFIAFSRWDGQLVDAGTHPVKYLQNIF